MFKANPQFIFLDCQNKRSFEPLVFFHIKTLFRFESLSVKYLTLSN